MGSFWIWVFLLAVFQALALPLLLAAPIRFSSYIPGGGTRATKLSSTHDKLQDTPDQQQPMLKNMKDDDPSLKLEDYNPTDPSPDSSTSKVTSSPIEHGMLLNPLSQTNPH